MSNSTGGFQQTIDWYNQNAKEYAQKIDNSPDILLIERFTEKLVPGAFLLDAGCAAGRDSRIFKDRGLEPVGIDISHGLIKLAQEKHPDIKFKVANFLNLPFKDNTFDGVWSHASLLHLEAIADMKKALTEFFRVLKPSGIAHIYVKQQLGDDKTANVSHQYSGEFKRFFRFYTKAELETLFKEVGFTILNLEDNYITSDSRPDIKWIVALIKKPTNQFQSKSVSDQKQQ